MRLHLSSLMLLLSGCGWLSAADPVDPIEAIIADHTHHTAKVRTESVVPTSVSGSLDCGMVVSWPQDLYLPDGLRVSDGAILFGKVEDGILRVRVTEAGVAWARIDHVAGGNLDDVSHLLLGPNKVASTALWFAEDDASHSWSISSDLTGSDAASDARNPMVEEFEGDVAGGGVLVGNDVFITPFDPGLAASTESGMPLWLRTFEGVTRLSEVTRFDDDHLLLTASLDSIETPHLWLRRTTMDGGSTCPDTSRLLPAATDTVHQLQMVDESSWKKALSSAP